MVGREEFLWVAKGWDGNTKIETRNGTRRGTQREIWWKAENYGENIWMVLIFVLLLRAKSMKWNFDLLEI